METNEKEIGIDVDGVARDFNQSVTEFYNRGCVKIWRPERCLPIFYEPRFYEEYHDERFYDQEVINSLLYHDMNVYKKAKPILAFYSFFYSLNLLGKTKFVTSQPNADAVEETKIWLKDTGFEDKVTSSPKVVYCSSKEKWKYCDWLIDDSPAVLLETVKHNKHSFCVARNYNQELQGSEYLIKEKVSDGMILYYDLDKSHMIFRGDYDFILSEMRNLLRFNSIPFSYSVNEEGAGV